MNEVQEEMWDRLKYVPSRLISVHEFTVHDHFVEIHVFAGGNKPTVFVDGQQCHINIDYNITKSKFSAFKTMISIHRPLKFNVEVS